MKTANTNTNPQATLLEDALKAHLDDLATKDKAFAERYANPKKSIAECAKYIMGEAYAMASGQRCVAISDEQTYGMAVHYYDEDDIQIRSTPGGGCAPAPSKPALTEEEKAAQAERIEAEIRVMRAERKEKEKAEKAKQKSRQEADATQAPSLFGDEF